MELPRLNPGVEAIRPYIPGKSVAEVARERGLASVVKMASNENALGMSPRALDALRAVAPCAYQYPEASTPELRAALARRHGVSPDQVITGNGSDSVIYVLGMTVLAPGTEVVIPKITFPVYETISRIMGARIVETRMDGYRIDLAEVQRAIGPATRMVWLCNPNNPTGTAFGEAEFEQFLERVPSGVLVVHDEVYEDFVEEPERFPRVARRISEGARNLFCIRSFSKIYGMAGLRLGYGIGPAELVSTMHRVRPPFDVSVTAERAGLAALEDEDFYRDTVRMVAEGRALLYRELAAMGLPFVRSHTNFVVVQVGGDDRQIADRLIDEGVIVRPGAGYGLAGHIRVTVGRPEDNRRFLAALRRVLASGGV